MRHWYGNDANVEMVASGLPLVKYRRTSSSIWISIVRLMGPWRRLSQHRFSARMRTRGLTLAPGVFLLRPTG